jgi:hypothetical protein
VDLARRTVSAETFTVIHGGAEIEKSLAGCLTTAAAAGGPLIVISVAVAEDLVAGLKALGVPVRYRQARQSTVADAELRAISQGWPVRYI